MKRLALLAPFALVASCGSTTTSASDASADAANDVAMPIIPCTSDADCPQGNVCGYSPKQQCAKQCFPIAPACKKTGACTCDHLQLVSSDCNGAFSQPVTPCPECAAGLACEICDVTGFSVSPMAKPSTAPSACTQGEIASFVSACLGASATETTCTAWKQSDAGVSSCGACAVTQASASAWGPVVCNADGCSVNEGGCVDIVGAEIAQENGTNASCGDLTNAANECLAYACFSCSPNDFDTCAQAAKQSECKSYFDAVQTSSQCAKIDGGASVCAPQSDADYATFINVFCGTGP